MFLWVFSEVITKDDHFKCFCLRWDHIFLIECEVSVSGELIVEYHFQDPTFLCPSRQPGVKLAVTCKHVLFQNKRVLFMSWRGDKSQRKRQNLTTWERDSTINRSPQNFDACHKKKKNFNSIRDSAEQTSLCHCSLRSALSKNTSAVTDKNKMKKKQKKTGRVTALTKHGCV